MPKARETKLKVDLVEHTPDPEKTIAMAARQCYYPDDALKLKLELSDEWVEAFLTKLISSGHTSTLEHASFVFFVSGISRACSHQLVRHRMASFSQQSQRYVSFEDGFMYVVPPSIKKDKANLERFRASMEAIAEAYAELGMSGVKAEDARFLLPNAAETKIAVTMNARSMLNFFKERTCRRAQWEIRAMAEQMLDKLREVAPTIASFAGPTCKTEGICWQSEKDSCGLWKSLGAERRDKVAGSF